MPGPFAPVDALIGPIVHALAVIIQAQIPSIAFVYEELPDRTPGDNTVIIPLTKGVIKDESNGKQEILFTFTVRHLFRRKSMADNILQAYSYMFPWLQMLSAWPNLTLGGLVRQISTSEVMVTQIAESGQPMVALTVVFTVLTEYNIPLV